MRSTKSASRASIRSNRSSFGTRERYPHDGRFVKPERRVNPVDLASFVVP